MKATSSTRSRAEYLAIGITLYLFTFPFLLFQQFSALIDSINFLPIAGIQIINAVRYSLYFTVLLFSIPLLKKLLAAAYREKGILILIALALLSTFWSGVPGRTLYYAASILLTTYIGYYIAVRFSPRRQLLLLGVVLGIAVFINLVAAILFPEQAIEDHRFLIGAWNGVQVHKNDLGLLAALSTTLFWTGIAEEAFEHYKALWWAGFILSCFILVASYSRGALAAILAAHIVWLVFNFVKRGILTWRPWLQRHQLDFILAACLICILIISLLFRPASYLLGIVEPLKATPNSEPDVIAPSLKMSTTLTGRIPIWFQLMDKIQVKPVLGYGYYGFWTGSKSPPSGDIRFGNNAWPNYAHNGYLEFVLDFGVSGLLIFLIQLGVTLSRAFSAHSFDHTTYFRKTVPYLLIVLAVVNLVDSAFMESRLHWIIYVCIATTLANQADLPQV